MASALLLGGFLLLQLFACHAYPEKWVVKANDVCSRHPARGYDRHGAPIPDR